MRSLSGLLGQAEREADAAAAVASASRARLLGHAAPPFLLPPPPLLASTVAPLRAQLMLRGNTREAAGRYGGARVEKAADFGADFEEVENELTSQRVEDEKRAPALTLAMTLLLALCVALIAAGLDMALMQARARPRSASPGL
ncbi:hypothetical protein T492DRAFT_892469 [Pavlovales sp. CCMP2436]|nr:hypothetical protein T492DRAFT_892469 [Pavlovales sp. CCMP2436]